MSLQGNDRFRIEAEKGERTNEPLIVVRGEINVRLEILLTLFRTVGGVRQKGHGRPFSLSTHGSGEENNTYLVLSTIYILEV
jgi:hypothetical protein